MLVKNCDSGTNLPPCHELNVQFDGGPIHPSMQPNTKCGKKNFKTVRVHKLEHISTVVEQENQAMSLSQRNPFLLRKTLHYPHHLFLLNYQTFSADHPQSQLIQSTAECCLPHPLGCSSKEMTRQYLPLMHT
ncbi:hypothetical protein E2542_SST16001 [Spatholobus suberectus]|nr:hypothetical protein E2542_SST16001 [Spatholobus suberectus]